VSDIKTIPFLPSYHKRGKKRLGLPYCRGYLRINPNDAEISSLLKKSTDILEKLAKFKNIAGKKT
jgi:hypothetical protein